MDGDGGRRRDDDRRDVDDDDPLLVSLLDGTVCAVDRDTGETVWSFSSGGPLVRASGGGGDGGGGRDPAIDDGDDDDDDDADAIRGRPRGARPATVFPGVDGSLYSLSHRRRRDRDGGESEVGGAQSHVQRVVTRLPITARQLVDASPSATRDGAVVIGKRTSVVFALDAKSGTLLRTFGADGTVVRASASASSGGNAEEEEDDDDDAFTLEIPAASEGEEEEFDGAVYVGRTEFAVRSVDALTGVERWNVTYGELRPLLRRGGAGPGPGPGPAGGWLFRCVLYTGPHTAAFAW